MAEKTDKEKTQKTQKRVTIDDKPAEDNPSGIKGAITLNEDVVTTIAVMAAREVDGIHSVGQSGFLTFGDAEKRGMKTEIGKIQAAFDVDVVIEYGQDIRKVAHLLREKIGAEVNKMAGREVVEININVVDIKLPDDNTEERSSKGRVV